MYPLLSKIHTVGLYRFDLVVNRAHKSSDTNVSGVKGNYQVMPVNNWLLLKFYYQVNIMRADVKTDWE